MSNGIDKSAKLQFLDMEYISGELPYNNECNKLTGEDCATRSDTITVVKGEDAQDADIKFGDQSSEYAVCVETERGKYYTPGSFTGNGEAGPTICIFGDPSLASKVRKIKGEPEPEVKLSHEERVAKMKEVGNDPRIVDGFNALKGEDRIKAFNFALAQVNAGVDIPKVIELTVKKIDELR